VRTIFCGECAGAKIGWYIVLEGILRLRAAFPERRARDSCERANTPNACALVIISRKDRREEKKESQYTRFHNCTLRRLQVTCASPDDTGVGKE
jgi:hypothetical protein